MSNHDVPNLQKCKHIPIKDHSLTANVTGDLVGCGVSTAGARLGLLVGCREGYEVGTLLGWDVNGRFEGDELGVDVGRLVG